MNNNEKLNTFFTKIEHKLFGADQDKLKKLKSLNNDELLLRYVDLKAKNYINEKLSFVIVPGFSLAILAGLAKLIYDFIQRTISMNSNQINSEVILSGGIFFLIVVTISFIMLLIFYWKNMKDNKKEYFLIEFLLKEKKIEEVSESE